MSGGAKARLAYHNIFARDIERLSAFYADVFGFAEIIGHRSPIYRCLDAGGIELGFNAPQAYALLNIAPPDEDSLPATRTYPTFEVAEPALVAQAAERTCELGGSVKKPPYQTYYNAVQTVLLDPEGNVFRVNHRLGPRPSMDTLVAPPWGRQEPA